MILRKWDKLPKEMQNEEVRYYYDVLLERRVELVMKRLFDIVASLILLIILSPVFFVLAVAIKVDSKGPVFYRQTRVTQYGKLFRIFKFRTMVQGADKVGCQVTIKEDKRITRVGRVIRKYRLDEICQLIDVMRGTMSFVGTRPEATKYVKEYTKEMRATLLMPAGITSEASIRFKDEATLLTGEENIDEAYVKKILPQKMRYNLESIKKFSFWNDLLTLLRTVAAVLGKEY